jgi:hypothetical protein
MAAVDASKHEASGAGMTSGHRRFLKFLKLRMSGHFYRLDGPMDRRFSTDVFSRIQTKRGIEQLESEPHFKGTPRSSERSALCVFEIKRPPAFAPGCPELSETRHGFCCLIEARQVLFVAHTGFAWSDALLPLDEPQTLTPEEARAVLGSLKEPLIDKVATRSMSVATKSIHSRTTEGSDLEASLPSLGASRHVVRAIRAVEGTTGATLHVVPGSSRLTQQGPRVDFDGTVAWFRTEMLRRIESKKTFAFLGRFAQAIRFDELPTSVEPKGLSLALAFPSFDGTDWEYESRAGQVRSVKPALMRRLFDRLRLRLSAPVELVPDGARLVASYPAPVGRIFVRENKKSYSLENDFLRRIRFIDPDTLKPRGVLSALNESREFAITFSDLDYAYVNAQLVKSAHVKQSLKTILEVVEAHDEISSATSEKGNGNGQIDSTSLFGVIEATCAKADELLLLDDGGTEWADYVGISHKHKEPILSFYHAKYTGKPSTSASVLQEVVAQAEKNLGWLIASPSVLVKRHAEYWTKKFTCPAGGKVPRLRRIKPGSSARDLLEQAASNSRTRRRACIVVSSLTKGALRELAKSNGIDLKPYQSQLAWLLATFVSACRDAGVDPVIMCPR